MASTPRVRDDLEYFDQEIDGDDTVLIKDPVRGTYIRFNPLQAAMLRALDGHRTPAQIAAELSARFEVEIPPGAAERFIARARSLMLLELSAYDTTSKAALAQVRRALRKAGFWLHAPEPDAPPATSPDGAALAAAFAELDRGHPRAAAAHLERILALAPDHARARELHRLIQTAYLRAAGSTTDFPTWVIFDPQRVLAWTSRTLGGFLFSAAGVAAMLVVFGIGVYAYTNVSFDHIAFGPREIAIAIAIKTISGLLHELGHGIACQHYGGNVTEIGFTLFYYVQPAFYCDTSSSYKITRRRHKMIVQLAGTVMSLMFNSVLAVIMMLLRPDVAIYPGLALVLVIASALVVFNMNPFLKFDGYYAICDYFGFPNLRDRSFKLARAWLGRRLFGLELPSEDLPARTRGVLIGYAMVSFVVTVWFIYVGFSRVLVPVVEHYRGPGLIVSVVVAGYLLRNLTLRALWQLARLIARERRRIFSRRRTLALGLLVAAALGPWFIQWPVMVDAELVARPSQRADVRAQVAGRVVELRVHDGDHVRRGQPIAILRNAALTARIAMAEAAREAAQWRLTALRHGARSEELAVAHRRFDHARADATRATREAELAGNLVDAELAPQASADTAGAQLATVTGTLGAARWSMSLLDAGTRPEDIAAGEAEVARIAAELSQLRGDQALLTLRSPIDGVVATAHVEDKLEAMLAPGDLLTEIHDLDTLVAEIALAPGDPLAEIATGRDVALRLYGTPDDDVRVPIARVREAAQGTGDATPQVVLVTAPFAVGHPVTGLTGHARIYGARRSLAYANLYLPIQRLIRVRLWSMW